MQKLTPCLIIVALVAGCSQTDDGASVQTSTAGTDTQPAPPVVPPPSPVAFVSIAAGLPESGMWKCDPVIVDLNGDGHQDLAALPRLGTGPRVWLGDGAGGWRESSEGLLPGGQSCGGGLAVAKANDDEHLDLIVADHCTGIWVYLGNGQGEWRVVTRGLAPAPMVTENAPEGVAIVGAEDLDVGDVNDDGHLDIIAGSSDEGGINIYLGDGTGTQWTQTSGSLPQRGWANRVQLVDMNGDGRLDIVATYDGGPRVWLSDGAGDWEAASSGLPSPSIRGLYRGLAAADVNGDQRLDIVVANWVDGPEVYFQEEHGTWQKSPDVFPAMHGGAVGLGMGDVDGDGHQDIVVSGRLEREGGFVRGAFLLRGDGKGGWTYVPDSGLPTTGLSGVDGVTVSDIDGDGLADVVVGSGLTVESVPGSRSPAVPHRLLAWRTRKVSDEARAAHP